MTTDASSSSAGDGRFTRAVDTPAGTHAVANVVTVALPALEEPSDATYAGWLKDTNARLPTDVRVFARSRAPPQFNAGTACERRRYEFLVRGRRRRLGFRVEGGCRQQVMLLASVHGEVVSRAVGKTFVATAWALPVPVSDRRPVFGLNRNSFFGWCRP